MSLTGSAVWTVETLQRKLLSADEYVPNLDVRYKSENKNGANSLSQVATAEEGRKSKNLGPVCVTRVAY